MCLSQIYTQKLDYSKVGAKVDAHASPSKTSQLSGRGTGQDKVMLKTSPLVVPSSLASSFMATVFGYYVGFSPDLHPEV